MTKTLTEQWREGTLKEGYYYIIIKDMDGIIIDSFDTWYHLKGNPIKQFSYVDIQEVLDPVPTYNEYQALLSDHLAKQAEIIEELEAENNKLKDRLDNAHRTLCEVLRISLSDEKDISKIYDIVNPTLEKLNQPLI